MLRDVKNSLLWIPRPKNPWISKSKIKTMLICFFDIRGNIQFESIPEGATVNQTFYVEVLNRLADAVRCKRGELWRDRSSILHEKALARPSLPSVAVFGRKRQLCRTLLTWLQLTSGCFRNSQRVPKGKRFSDAEDIKSVGVGN
jgi:hypothetical protein